VDLGDPSTLLFFFKEIFLAWVLPAFQYGMGSSITTTLPYPPVQVSEVSLPHTHQYLYELPYPTTAMVMAIWEREE